MVSKKLHSGSALPSQTAEAEPLTPDQHVARDLPLPTCRCRHDRLDHDLWGSGPCCECDCERFADPLLN